MKLFHAPSLVELTTLRVGGHAIALIMPETREDVERIPEISKKLGGSPFMLGRGSNLLAPDGEIPLVLIRPMPYSKPVIIDEDSTYATVHVDASMPLPRLIAWAAAHGLAGLEHLTGIPGEVGGAIRMNAGSYGASFCECLVETEIFSFETGFHTVPINEMRPTYRRTVFFYHDAAPFIILSATLKLKRADVQSIRAESRAIMARKASTQPMKAWSAGCAFTNPEGHSVGKLLDDLGFKGIKL